MDKTHMQVPLHSGVRLNPQVFFSSAAVILLLGAVMVIYPQATEAWLGRAQDWVSQVFGWYYMLVMVACLVFVLWLAASRYGHIKLGQDDEKPAFGYTSWISMLDRKSVV